ncbi:phage repressor protein [Xenorhabdus mauleonii]|uniref:Phage repressor protein n=1 Tax=Xenorhabdus mauleonii TaxID=351675 RepID=A0A1I3WML9_9GAMM|nr:S24 family peptidase [Xenorhabdus mauleonii]PHM39291.1 phage repressor protein [Xenorhabdus mauleonii]SFK08722.1 Phage repressor protein C, contains Cro/C1-type HTH and peptisase s24 domains [Xenorhabdus mauleonii]
MSLEADTLNRNIKYLMLKHGINSVTELSKRVKMQQSTLHRMVTGEVKDPKYTVLKNIADFFGISPIDLIECDLQAPKQTTIVEIGDEYYTQNFTNIPVRGDIVISDMEECLGSPTNEESNHYLRWPSYDKDVYAVKCKGTSLMPRIKDGEYVVIEPNHKISPGDEVLIIATDDSATVKTFLFEREDQYHLLPLNEDHAPIRSPKNTIKTLHYVAGLAKPNLIIK